MACSIARTLDILGDPWSFLILRNVLVGMTRFDQIQRGLGISRKVLAERLAWIVEQGVLERRAYSEHPPRYDYTLTDKGRELCDVLIVIAGWGDRWTAGEAGPPVLRRHRSCGEAGHTELRCSECGEPLHASDIDFEPGPGYVPDVVSSDVTS
jgi:DNA-binding HxlR family transcriptional regulator